MKMCRLIPLSFFTVLAGLTLGADSPPTKKAAVTDEYHGVKVVDEYRWLEDGEAPAVKEWTALQNAHTRAYLDKLPNRAGIEARLQHWYAKVTPSRGDLASRPGRLFALKFQPPKQQRLLVILKSANDLNSEKVILDPNELEPKGQVAMDWYVPSRDGKLVAVCLSKNGSEEGDLHIYNTQTGEHLTDVISRVQYPTGGGGAAWNADATGIFYTRYPRKGERAEGDLNFYQQVYLHKLGTSDSADVYAVGKDFPRIAETRLETSDDGRWLLASVANGDGGEHAHFLHDLHSEDVTAWRQVTHFADGVKEVAMAHDSTALYLRSVKDAPRGKILSMALDRAADLKNAKEIVPESDAVIEGLTPTKRFLFVAELIGGPSRIRRFDLDGKNGVVLPLSPNAGVGELVALKEHADDGRVLFQESSFTEPDGWHIYDPATGAAAKTALFNTSPVDFSDIESVREFAVSRDGTQVPLTILRRKGTKLDGNNPTLLYAYGGYGISMRPRFRFTRREWFDHGGVSVVANIRGGGEFGEAWHLAGNLTRKQNVFDDFAACAEHLIKIGYTRPEKLAVEGGSNGGLLMGAFLTQHPRLARAVVSHVGIYDMLRVELDPNGAFNVTEFGTVKDLSQFQALHAYSPYHRVVDGARYPAVFFLAGENDGRVNPSNSRKMTARLQAATGSGLPIFLRLGADSGHDMGTALSEKIRQEADVFAFLFDQLGMADAPAR